MKLRYSTPKLQTLRIEQSETLLEQSDWGTLTSYTEGGSGFDAGTSEKFVNPIWGDDLEDASGTGDIW